MRAERVVAQGGAAAQVKAAWLEVGVGVRVTVRVRVRVIAAGFGLGSRLGSRVRVKS